MYVGIGIIIASLIFFIVKLPSWKKSGEINELKDKRMWKVAGLIILGVIVFFILFIVLIINLQH